MMFVTEIYIKFLKYAEAYLTIVFILAETLHFTEYSVTNKLVLIIHKYYMFKFL